jgi:hypothetical protein
MSSHYHAIVWIDHREARIFEFSATDTERIVVHSHGSNHHLHHKSNSTGSGHVGIDTEFLGRVMAALGEVGAFLITGPAAAKSELNDYISKHSPALAKRISAVEALDHPSDGALVALARKFFKASDRLHA